MRPHYHNALRHPCLQHQGLGGCREMELGREDFIKTAAVTMIPQLKSCYHHYATLWILYSFDRLYDFNKWLALLLQLLTKGITFSWWELNKKKTKTNQNKKKAFAMRLWQIQSHILYKYAHHCKRMCMHAWTSHVPWHLMLLYTISDFSGQRCLNVNCSRTNAVTDRL